MRSIKRALPGWYNIDVRHYLSWQWLAHPEGSCDRPADAVPCPTRLLPARTCRRMPVLLSSPDLPWPARCSRDTAKVAVFRLASTHPDRATGSGYTLRQKQSCHFQEKRRMGSMITFILAGVYHCTTVQVCTVVQVIQKFLNFKLYLLRGEAKTWQKQKADRWKLRTRG